jgi:hypothetical protein
LYMGKRACQREEIVIDHWLASTSQAIISPEHKSEITKWLVYDFFLG